MSSNCNSGSSRTILIAANPNSGAGAQGHLIRQLQSALDNRGFSAQVISSLEQLTKEVDRLLAHNHLEAVVAAGGDGTVSLLANLLPASVPLGIFPLGTENLLARYWGITNDIESACGILLGGRVVHMDAGSANGKLFLIMLSCGFDAEVVHRMHVSRKGHIRRWMYALPILRSLASYRFPMMSYQTVDAGEGHAGLATPGLSAPWVFLFNVPKYAASLDICPQADPTDGRLDLCTFERSGILSGMYYLYQTWRGAHEELPEFCHAQIRSLTINSPIDSHGKATEVPFQLDGDPGGVLPLKVETLPGRLKLLVPESTATSDPIPAIALAAAT